MKQFKNRFKVNDAITQFKNNEPIRKGTVVKGPFRVENIDHYHVTWNWEDKEHGTPEWFKKPNADLICDMVSTKYQYT